jgi:hypothetical protein
MWIRQGALIDGQIKRDDTARITPVVANKYRFKGKTRYCETCETYQPRGNRPAVKGWKCDECRGKHDPR